MSIFTTIFLINSCQNKQSDSNQFNNDTSKIDTVAIKIVKDSLKNKKSLTKEEALKRFNQYLNQNKKKYAEFGDLENIQLSSGDYTGDGALEYFFEAKYYPGGDYVYPEYFYYDSETDQFFHLKKGKESEYIYTYSFKKIEHNLITGSVSLFTAFSGIDYFTEEVDASFHIENYQIILNKEYLTKLKQAEKTLKKRADEAIKKNIINEE